MIVYNCYINTILCLRKENAKMKKTLFCTMALILSVLAAVPAYSCGNGSTDEQTEDQTKPDANQESAADEDGDIFSALRGKDFGWTKITILCRDNEGSSYKNEFGITEETGDIVEDAIYKRNLTVSNLLNVDIETITMDGSWNNQDEFMGLIRNSVAAGDHEYDIITGYQAYITQLAMGGEVINMLDLPYVDYTQPWWNGETIEQNTVNGKCFFVNGDIGLSTYYAMSVVYFNKRIAEELDLGDVYQLVHDGKWTKEKAAEFSKAAAIDLNGNSKMDLDSDRFGYATNHAHEHMNAFHRSMSTIESGKPVLNLMNEDVVDVFDWVRKFYYKSDGVAPINKSAVDYKISLGMFTEGRSLLYPDSLGSLSSLRDMSDDFGVLPLFKWDEEQKDYYSLYLDFLTQICVPVTSAESADAIGAVLEAMAIDGHYNVVPAFYDVAVKSKYVRDNESIEMIELTRKNVVQSFVDIYGGCLDMLSNLLNNYAQKHIASGGDYTSYAASNIDKWQAKLDSLIEIFN